MKISPLVLDDVWIATSNKYDDERGFFMEWFKQETIKDVTGKDFKVAQANLSSSKRGVIRGIHYSLAPKGQAKLVTCVSGSIRDFVIDIRVDSLTFGKWISVDLFAGDGQALIIGENLGHAFVALEDNAIVSYLVTSSYSPSEEFGIHPFDDTLNIQWGLPASELVLSPKDDSAPTFLGQLAAGKLPK